jgi:hypothetical protein
MKEMFLQEAFYGPNKLRLVVRAANMMNPVKAGIAEMGWQMRFDKGGV